MERAKKFYTYKSVLRNDKRIANGGHLLRNGKQ